MKFRTDFKKNKRHYLVAGIIGGLIYTLIGLYYSISSYLFWYGSVSWTNSVRDIFIFIPKIIAYIIRSIGIFLNFWDDLFSTDIFLSLYQYLFHPTGFILIILSNFLFGFFLVTLIFYGFRRLIKK